MLYLTVLALEFSGIVFEKLGWKRAVAIQHAATVPLVIAGAVISTLHQSSLGTFYLMTAGKLHALWYTPLLPVLFFLSAVAGRPRDDDRRVAALLPRPRARARDAAADVDREGPRRRPRRLRRRRASPTWPGGGCSARSSPGSREAGFFQLEMAIGVILPMALLALPAVRRNSGRLYGAALLVVAGFVVNRLNVSITGLEGAQGGHYVPTIAEGIITLMLVGIGIAAFGLAVRFLPDHGRRSRSRSSSVRGRGARAACWPPCP